MNGAAIQSYVRQQWLRPVFGARATLKNMLKKRLGTAWFWRRFGSDFVLLLEASPGASGNSR
jgi:hypothetical protein